MTILEISQALLLSVIISGAIGFDREFKNRPAGMRTHILVCVGATIVALLQTEIYLNTIKEVVRYPEFVGIIRSDQTRLIAQVISGIGFLGAGTIVVTKKAVEGLTTAASLWSVACLGLTVGMGYYQLSIIGFIVIQITLSLLKKIIVIPSIKKLEIKYICREETQKFIITSFSSAKIIIKDIDVDVEILNNQRIYTTIYTIEVPKNMNIQELIEYISIHKNMMKVKLYNL
ncbi:MgtC/SapB family protein [Vagococcus carniphilus]|uniref:Magnesium transporter MgtC n=1 Tax=Vagococcus carniphilus TaxID=218144 RepID=A0A430ATG3_9ENTE|nr:MgtC/SapB family protein [Vagococcus carniphilus]QNN73290.1 MgtC/SapB family protein [Vagococcus carniphilus]RSU11337.1 magnesium transporter MgtC [Vagococcus carniphilus]